MGRLYRAFCVGALLAIAGCLAATTEAGRDAKSVSGIEAKLTAIDEKLEVGGNYGLSSRGIVILGIVLVAGAVIVVVVLNESNDRITRKALSEAGRPGITPLGD